MALGGARRRLSTMSSEHAYFILDGEMAPEAITMSKGDAFHKAKGKSLDHVNNGRRGVLVALVDADKNPMASWLDGERAS
jgi:hypothetical protein